MTRPIGRTGRDCTRRTLAGAALLVALVTAPGLGPAGGSAAAAPPDSVRIAIHRHGAPYTLIDPTGAPAGLMVDLWRLWSDAAGVPVRFIASEWADTLEAVRNGRADIHFGLFHTPERARWLAFSDAIHEVDTALFVRDDAPVPSSLADLRHGATVGTLIGTQQNAWFDANRPPHLRSAGFFDTTGAFIGLLRGAVDAVIEEAPSAAAATNRIGVPGRFQRSPQPLYTEALRAAVRAGEQELIELVDDGFRSIPRRDLARVESRWLPDPADHFYAGATGEITLTDAETAWLEANPIVRFATTPTYPPYSSYDDDGVVVGFDLDFVKLLNQKLGTAFVTEVFETWDAATGAGMAWQIDGVLGMASTPERAERMLFTAPYAFEPMVLVGRRDGVAVDSWDALSGHVVSVEGGAVWGDRLEGLVGPDGRVNRVEDDALGYGLVRRGVVDFHMGWRNTYDSARRAGDAEGLVVHLTRNTKVGTLRIGVPRDRRPLLQILRKGMNAITVAEMSRLRERWFGLADHAGDDGGSVVLTPRERAWLRQHATLTVANELDWPPFDFAEAGTPKGFAIDSLRLAGRKLGLGLQFINGYTWAELMARFRAGEIDILPAIYRTPEREAFIAFTDSYATNPSVLVARVDRDDITGAHDLRGRRVAVVRGFATSLVMAQRWPDIEQHEVANVLDALKAVSVGQVDGFVGSLGVISYVMAETYLPDLRLVGEVAIKQPDETRLHMGVARDRTVLRDLLQKGLDAISAEEMAGLRSRWLQVLDPPRDRVPLTADQRVFVDHHRRWRVGDDFATPPFSFLDRADGFSGISAGYLALAAERLGVELATLETPSRAEALRRLAAGTIDLVVGVTAADTRALGGLVVTDPYVSFPVVIATRRDGRFVGRLDDLAGARVGIGSRHLDVSVWQADHPELTIVPLPSAAEGIAAVTDRTIDAYLDDVASVTHAIEQVGHDGVRIAAPTDQAVAFAVAVRPDWAPLGAILDAAFATVSDVDRAAIRNTWLAVHLSFGLDLATVLVWVAPFAASAGVIIAVVMLWNRRLGAEIAERKQAQAKLSDAYEVIQSSIGYASQIQRSLLPDPDGLHLTFRDHFVVWQPRDLVGGDMIWNRPWGDGVLMVVGDCTGHGVPGAFMTLIATGALDRAQHEVPPGAVGTLVQRLNQLVQRTLGQDGDAGDADDGLELGACYVPAGAPPRELIYCGARFSMFITEPDPACTDRGTALAVREIKGCRKAIGYRAIPFDQSYPEQRIEVHPGMTFYLLTDGVVDQVGGEKRRAFGRRRLVALLAGLGKAPLASHGTHIGAALNAHQGDELRRDDVTVVGFRLA